MVANMHVQYGCNYGLAVPMMMMSFCVSFSMDLAEEFLAIFLNPGKSSAFKTIKLAHTSISLGFGLS